MMPVLVNKMNFVRARVIMLSGTFPVEIRETVLDRLGISPQNVKLIAGAKKIPLVD